MKHEQVQKLFLDWSEGRVDEMARPRIQAHLDECGECRNYYEKIALLLAKPARSDLAHLDPDPFLPARIRALASEDAEPQSTGRRFGVLRASFATMIFATAITAGVFLGNGLSNISHANDDADLAAAYYTTFSQAGFADDLQTIVDESQDEL